MFKMHKAEQNIDVSDDRLKYVFRLIENAPMGDVSTILDIVPVRVNLQLI
jgi:hypothetical protein